MIHDQILFFGDSITIGGNDSEGLSWPGRLARGLVTHNGDYVTGYNLGVNGDTSVQIATRWQAEVLARSRKETGLLVFAFGFNDAAKPVGGKAQVDLETSVTTARTMMQAACGMSDVLWIGPTPLDESVNPMQTASGDWDMRNDEIASYDAAYAQIASELGVPYLRLLPDFRVSERYQRALRTGDKVHPSTNGYALIAETVAGWEPWKAVLKA
jgi:acyl-CoA thioesterase-1